MTEERSKMTAVQARARLVDGFTLGTSCITYILGFHSVSIQSLPGSGSVSYNMISSTALPKETLSKAPKVSPNLLATLSVAWVSRPAKGTIAMAFMAKITSGFKPATFTAMPTGTKMSNTLTQLWKIASFV